MSGATTIEYVDVDSETESDDGIEIESVHEDVNENDDGSDDDAAALPSSPRQQATDTATGTRTSHAKTVSARERRIQEKAARCASTNNRIASPHSAVAPVQDSFLMGVVIAHMPQFADRKIAPPHMSVWQSIAATYSERFPLTNTRSPIDPWLLVKKRVTWLATVLRCTTHRQHAQLTFDLKDLIRQFQAARQELRLQHQLFQLQQGDNCDIEQFPNLTATRNAPAAPLDAALEEKVMAIVLLHAPRLASGSNESKRAVWHAIACDSRGRYSGGLSAMARTAHLCKVMSNETHREHDKITPALRAMLLAYLQVTKPSTLLVVTTNGDDDADGGTSHVECGDRHASPQAKRHRAKTSETTRRRTKTKRQKTSSCATKAPAPAPAAAASPESRQSPVTTLNDAVGRDRERELGRVKGQVAALESQVARQAASFESERQQHREELRELRADMRAMMDILTQERAAHTRETMAMLSVIQGMTQQPAQSAAGTHS